MNKQIHLTLNGKPMLAVSGITLSEIINGERPCGGHGRCGKCKVRVLAGTAAVTDEDGKVFSEQELAEGWGEKFNWQREFACCQILFIR